MTVSHAQCLLQHRMAFATLIIWVRLTNGSAVQRTPARGRPACIAHHSRTLRENSNILTNQVLIVIAFQRNRDNKWKS